MKYCMNVISATKSPMLRECSCCGISVVVVVVGSPLLWDLRCCGVSVVVESLLLWNLCCCGISVVVGSVVVGSPLLWALRCCGLSIVLWFPLLLVSMSASHTCPLGPAIVHCWTVVHIMTTWQHDRLHDTHKLSHLSEICTWIVLHGFHYWRTWTHCVLSLYLCE